MEIPLRYQTEMKHLPLFLLLLLAFRICIVPAGYVRYASELKQHGVAFEQIRVKNRRSSYLEEGDHISENHPTAAAIAVSFRRFLFTAKKRVVRHFIAALPSFNYHLLFPATPRCRYLLNRAFRI